MAAATAMYHFLFVPLTIGMVWILVIMLLGTVYPLVFTRPDGSANQSLAFALFWSMSAGLVRGVGSIPRALIWKILFSGGSCVAGLALATWTRLYV